MLNDTRDSLEAYTTVDAAIQYNNEEYDFKLTLSAKNIFDASVKLPSAPNTYSEDYAQEQRNFLVSFTKEF